MMRAWRLPPLAALIAAAAPIALPAQGTLPEWGRALTPAQGREIRAEIGRLSSRLGVRQNTLVAIARVLGTNLRNASFAELVERVRFQAGRAAELQAQIGQLRTQIAALSDAAVRDPARQALARATAAFEAGRLADADREFAALESLRRSESEAARAAWVDAVDARARIAELRLDFDAAEGLRLSAAREERRLSTVRQWRLVMGAAEARQKQGVLMGGRAPLERAIVLYRDEALPLAPRDQRPLDWAETLNYLGNALRELGTQARDTAILGEAVRTYQAALQEYTRERAPHDWAITQADLASALAAWGELERSTSRLQQAVSAYRAALAVMRDHSQYAWGVTQYNLSHTLGRLAAWDPDRPWLAEAVQALEAALQEVTREQLPREWAMIYNGLGNLLMTHARRANDAAAFERAAASYASALQEFTRERTPIDWTMAMGNLGEALLEAGRRRADTTQLTQAVAAYQAALQEQRREGVPLDWGQTMTGLAEAIALIAERTGNRTLLDEAERRARSARLVHQSRGSTSGVVRVDEILRRIAAMRGRRSR